MVVHHLYVVSDEAVGLGSCPSRLLPLLEQRANLLLRESLVTDKVQDQLKGGELLRRVAATISLQLYMYACMNVGAHNKLFSSKWLKFVLDKTFQIWAKKYTLIIINTPSGRKGKFLNRNIII